MGGPRDAAARARSSSRLGLATAARLRVQKIAAAKPQNAARHRDDEGNAGELTASPTAIYAGTVVRLAPTVDLNNGKTEQQTTTVFNNNVANENENKIKTKQEVPTSSTMESNSIIWGRTATRKNENHK